jgi:hypothetical protein
MQCGSSLMYPKKFIIIYVRIVPIVENVFEAQTLDMPAYQTLP